MIYIRYLAEPIRSHPKYDTIAVAAIHVFANVDSIESKINEIESSLLNSGWLVLSQDPSASFDSLPDQFQKKDSRFLSSWAEAQAKGLSFVFEPIKSKEKTE
jgi:hypothetical protein